MKSKDQKRAEAAERQTRHDVMPGFDKLAKLLERPGNSSREKARILAAS